MKVYKFHHLVFYSVFDNANVKEAVSKVKYCREDGKAVRK